jgi:hypothetical protein
MTPSKPVILWGREDLVCWAVESSLTNQGEREVIRISDERSFDDLLRIVGETQPGVVIIHQGNCATDTLRPMLILREHPQLKVILVSLENNTIEVFHRKKACIREMSDLLSLIEE